jgi:hypothetical protein
MRAATPRRAAHFHRLGFTPESAVTGHLAVVNWPPFFRSSIEAGYTRGLNTQCRGIAGILVQGKAGLLFLVNAIEELQPRGDDLLNGVYGRWQDFVGNDLVRLPG